jgi:hypothetical protein
MRRSFAAGLLSLGAVAQPVIGQTLDELLTSRTLESVVHPIAAQFLAEEGADLLPEMQKSLATSQLMTALQRQTSPMVLMMRGVGGAMNTPSTQRMQEQAQQAASAGRGGIVGGLIRSTIGLGPSGGTPAAIDAGQAAREMQQAMAEPWVRGIGAARAMAALGDAQAAARFYVACLEMVDADWVPDACLEDILTLGARRALVLLEWMLDNADTVSFMPTDLQPPGAEPDGDRDRDAAPSPGAVQLRATALEGLGALVGSGLLPDDERERAFAKLANYASGRDNEPYFKGAAEGLARSQDARAVRLLDTLSEMRGSPDVRQAALRGLAGGFRDGDAIGRLRRGRRDRHIEVQLRAAHSLD